MDIQLIDYKKLILDEENPRLPENLARDQASMLNYIAQTTAIDDLMEAIAENNFFPGEPLVVIRKQDKYIVVEGNRRLTAVILLNDPSRCSKRAARLREISEQAKYRPESLPVVIHDNRKDVLPYLGFRHITGVKQWEPLAKARYIKQLFDAVSSDFEPKKRYSEVARIIGSRQDHIKRNLDALAVYEVIKENDFYGIDELNEENIKFSVLSTAIADDRIGNFVGVSKEMKEGDFKPTNPIVDPASLKHTEIKELTEWLYKKDMKGVTRIGESRNLRKLSAVINNQRALSALKSGATLKIAYEQTADLTHDFTELLYHAEADLTEAAGMIATVNYDEDAFLVAKRIIKTIRLIGENLKGKRPNDDDF
jgi:hypothetical protein